MRTTAQLRSFAREAAAIAARDREIAQFEIYCASADHRIARISYTSEIPCRGVEEVKSLRADGFQVRIALRRNPHEIGAASEAADFSAEAVRHALVCAHRATVVDPNFPGFPSKPPRLTVRPHRTAADDLARAGDAVLVRTAWEMVRGALARFAASAIAAKPAPGLVLGGDLTVIDDRIAVANSNFADVRTDRGAHFTSSVTALIECLDAKATASALGRSAAELRRAGARLGDEAVARALALGHGARPRGGKWRVVLGPQPLAEILNFMVMGSLTSGAFYAANSAYQEKFGAQVMDERLSLSDEPLMRGGALSRGITCEGLPARRVELIRDGRLVGLLSNFYDTHRLASDERRAQKLGPTAGGVQHLGALPLSEERVRDRFAPLSGYRLGEEGGRRFDQHPGSAGTNVVMRARRGLAEEELIRAVGRGVYVGRIWYTYPINGQRAGDFTCTISGDSYMIRDGALAEPIAPSALRINANIEQVFNRVLAVGKRPSPALVWGAAQAYYVPAIALENVTFLPVENVGKS